MRNLALFVWIFGWKFTVVFSIVHLKKNEHHVRTGNVVHIHDPRGHCCSENHFDVRIDFVFAIEKEGCQSHLFNLSFVKKVFVQVFANEEDASKFGGKQVKVTFGDADIERVRR